VVRARRACRRIDATPSFSIAPVACEASSNAWEEVPPTMRTSRTPPSMARLAASSFRTMPRKRRGCGRAVRLLTGDAARIVSPSSTPATSVSRSADPHREYRRKRRPCGVCALMFGRSDNRALHSNARPHGRRLRRISRCGSADLPHRCAACWMENELLAAVTCEEVERLVHSRVVSGGHGPETGSRQARHRRRRPTKSASSAAPPPSVACSRRTQNRCNGK